jgi:molybdopterin molybdotransferase
MISFNEAHQLTLNHIQALPAEIVGLLAAEGRITAEDFFARVDAPSLDVSLKDGYAVISADIDAASPAYPISLSLAGSIAAGGDWQGSVLPGKAVRILSGAPLPDGADAVVSEEFTQTRPGGIQVVNNADPGRNILSRGADIQAGKLLVREGERLSPPVIGLLAAAGFIEVSVFRCPRVAILATGDEVLAPGQPLVPGKLYASNLFTLAAWCRHFGFEVETYVLPDAVDAIRPVLAASLERFDAVVTSGGAWKGEHDLIVQILDDLGWQKIYHRVRMGPGKAVGFGLLHNKPVFCLPVGPPSNHMAFIQLGLPGLQKLAGEPEPGLPQVSVRLAGTLSGQMGWTQFIPGCLNEENHILSFQSLKYHSRLQEMAHTQAIAKIPEGIEELPVGSTMMVQKLGD